MWALVWQNVAPVAAWQWLAGQGSTTRNDGSWDFGAIRGESVAFFITQHPAILMATTMMNHKDAVILVTRIETHGQKFPCERLLTPRAMAKKKRQYQTMTWHSVQGEEKEC